MGGWGLSIGWGIADAVIYWDKDRSRAVKGLVLSALGLVCFIGSLAMRKRNHED